MSELHSSLPVTYQGALQDYLAHPDETRLQQAYELGRAAMNAGLGVFDLIRLHHQALSEGVFPDDPQAAVRLTPAIEGFLIEALSPFELAQRGIRRARERLEALNVELAVQNETLAQNNAELAREIALREQSEAALREGKDRYFRLFREAQAMEENLHDLSVQVLSAQEDDRRRISRELHAEIVQALAAVNVTIALLKKQAGPNPALQHNVAKAEQLVAHSMETVHDFARELRPATLDHLGLESALTEHVAQFRRTTGMPVELITHPELGRLEEARGEILFRVVQEALNHFARRGATRIRIAFTAADGFLVAEISAAGAAPAPLTDDPTPARRADRLELLGIQERVRQLAGTFAPEVLSAGGRIRATIPLSAPVPASDPLADAASGGGASASSSSSSVS
jgi:signal transduction histidine kinase